MPNGQVKVASSLNKSTEAVVVLFLLAVRVSHPCMIISMPSRWKPGWPVDTEVASVRAEKSQMFRQLARQNTSAAIDFWLFRGISGSNPSSVESSE